MTLPHKGYPFHYCRDRNIYKSLEEALSEILGAGKRSFRVIRAAELLQIRKKYIEMITCEYDSADKLNNSLAFKTSIWLQKFQV